ncbi:MAG: hypothetical protein K9L65_17815, partial [Chromatiaceae bacterium]|nr:hypothetical protein [Chromatiaceae bacterium]
GAPSPRLSLRHLNVGSLAPSPPPHCLLHQEVTAYSLRRHHYKAAPIVNCQIPTDRPLFEQAFSQFVPHHERTQSGQKTGQNNGHIANQNRIN